MSGFLHGQAVKSVDRKGKHLLVAFASGRALHLHLGMTGRILVRRPEEQEAETHARLILRLDDKSRVIFQDPRIFGRVEVGDLETLRARIFDALGRDMWLDPPSGGELLAILSSTRRPVKVALLDQSLLAGVGNIHAAEALWMARIHPDVPGRALTAAEASRLAKAIRRTFARALRDLDALASKDVLYVQDSGSDNPFFVYGRAGELCPRCKKTPIARVEQSQRSTFFCPSCQADPSRGLSSRGVQAKFRARTRRG